MVLVWQHYGNKSSDDYFGPKISNDSEEIEFCRYRGYRSSPEEEVRYVINDKWMHVFTARLGFIVIFEHLVLVIKVILAYVIPDAPNNLRVQLQRERQNIREEQFEADQNVVGNLEPATDYDPEDLDSDGPSVFNSLPNQTVTRRVNSVSPKAI